MRPELGKARVSSRGLRPGLPTMVMLVHHASRTGAPIQGWNMVEHFSAKFNVVTVLMESGDLDADFEDVSDVCIVYGPGAHWHHVADEVAKRYQPQFAIANSAVTADLAVGFSLAGIPVVALVHEFSSYTRPMDFMAELLSRAEEVVMPADVVIDSFRDEYWIPRRRAITVMRQGKLRPPPRPVARGAAQGSSTAGVAALRFTQAQVPWEDFLHGLPGDAILVVGSGTVMQRKGVEFFVQTADFVNREHPSSPLVFAWIGAPAHAHEYAEFLHQQWVRSDLTERVVFLAEAHTLDPLLERADLFLLTSRLDPFPNVAIEAAYAGTPVIAFDRASGTVEWLAEDADLSSLVVPYLDTRTTAEVIVALAADHERRRRLGGLIQAKAVAELDMGGYCAALEELAERAVSAAGQRDSDFRTIRESGMFDPGVYSLARADEDADALLHAYLTSATRVVPREGRTHVALGRRPMNGFNPLAYEEQCPDFEFARDGDPFADWIRKGRPAGAWALPVLSPGPVSPEPDGQSVLVHGHFFYPDLLPEFLSVMGGGQRPVDLFLTTDSSDKADQLVRFARAYGTEPVQVAVVENRGRDLGGLLCEDLVSALDQYDLLMHVHGKRSPDLGEDFSRLWRSFLWENVAGGRCRMVDVTAAAFAGDASLGLVFPGDPNLMGWDLNKSIAERWAPSLGVASPLPDFFDFPVGMMFWARPAALAALWNARKALLDDFPEEPVPYDGTVLHAVERLLPFIVRDAGFTVAATSLPGVVR